MTFASGATGNLPAVSRRQAGVFAGIHKKKNRSKEKLCNLTIKLMSLKKLKTCNMKNSLILIPVILFNVLIVRSQSNTWQPVRKGFIFGVGIGAGSLSLATEDSINSNATSFSVTLPNIKIGYMLNKRLALSMQLPGAIYKYNGKDRGFEGIDLSLQYWIKEKWWVLGGTGITFDAPAFYTVKDPKEAGFYTGFPSFLLGTGYEIWHKDKFCLDIQYKAFYGKSNLINGHRQGFSNMFILGFNWY